MNGIEDERPDVLLVAMPPEALERPSIQLGTLAALLEREGLRAVARSLKLDFAEHCALATREAPEGEKLGIAEYKRLANDLFELGVGEWVFAVPPFREPGPADERYLAYLRRQMVAETDIAMALRYRAQAPAFLERCADDILALGPRIVGLSLTFAQNIPSLVLAKILKARDPTLVIVLGGSNCAEGMGAALHRAFPFVDYVVRGEAERVFPRLVRDVLAGRPVAPFPGLCARDAEGRSIAHPPEDALVGMEEVPLPDYDEYFERIAGMSFYATILPELKIAYESARGCWWGERQHCTFCGLNGTAMAFRSKSPDRVVEEVVELASRHERLDFQVVDNIIAMSYFGDVLPRLRDLACDARFFYETKANLRKEQVQLLRDAGVTIIQPGIESMSTPILALMRKGVTAFQNIRLLKWCDLYGIKVIWNVIYGFPGEPAAEYARMAEVMKLLTHLEPPNVSPLTIHRFSPYHAQPATFGIEIAAPYEYYEMLYPDLDPAERAEIAYGFSFRYLDGRDPDAYFGPVREVIDAWQAARETGTSQDSLCYRRGPGFLQVTDQRPLGKRAHYTFGEAESRIFLALADGGVLADAFRALEPDERDEMGLAGVQAFLGQLVGWGLAYEEEGRYVTLAVPDDREREGARGPTGRRVIPMEAAVGRSIDDTGVRVR